LGFDLRLPASIEEPRRQVTVFDHHTGRHQRWSLRCPPSGECSGPGALSIPPSPSPPSAPSAPLCAAGADLPNELWQTDITHVYLSDEREVEIINFIDDHSWLCVASVAE
jgi:hypothetical protein